MSSPWNVPAQRPSAETPIALHRFASPGDPRNGRVVTAPAYHPVPSTPGWIIDDGYVELGAPSTSMLRSVPAPQLPPEALMARPAWTTLWNAARAGTLEDWTYWQHHGERYRRAATAVVMLSIYTGFGVGAYFVYVSVQDKKAAAAAAAAAKAAAGLF